jgi:hypothetical protein
VNGWREEEDESTTPGCLHTLFQRHLYKAFTVLDLLCVWSYIILGMGGYLLSVWIEIEQMVGSFLIMVLVLPPRVSTGSFPLTLHTNR